MERPISSLWLPGTPTVISLACTVPRSAIVALQAAIQLAWIGDHLVGCACLLAPAKIAKREIAKKSRKAQLTVRIVFRSPQERAKFDAGLPQRLRYRRGNLRGARSVAMDADSLSVRDDFSPAAGNHRTAFRNL